MKIKLILMFIFYSKHIVVNIMYMWYIVYIMKRIRMNCNPIQAKMSF